MKSKERELAFQLGVHSSLDYKDIADKIGVTAKTITLWAKEDKWDEIKNARQTTDVQLVADLKEMLHRQVKDNRKKQEEGKFTKSDADAQLEIARTIESLEGGIALRTYVQVMEEFMDFIPHDNAKIKKELAEFQIKFLMHKAR